MILIPEHSISWTSLSPGSRTARRMGVRVATRATLASLVLIGSFPAAATSAGNASSIQPVRAFRHLIEVGQASWYGLKFQGRKTATGEPYDMKLMTCAHRSLPLGSWIKVTNLKNRRSVVVRVNDRGPALDDRIVDLSYAAAQAVGLRGLGKVRIDALHTGDPELAKSLMAQVQMPLIPGVLPR